MKTNSEFKVSFTDDQFQDLLREIVRAVVETSNFEDTVCLLCSRKLLTPAQARTILTINTGRLSKRVLAKIFSTEDLRKLNKIRNENNRQNDDITEGEVSVAFDLLQAVEDVAANDEEDKA